MMVMKRLLVSLLILCILLSCAGLFVYAEENQLVMKENLARMEGCTYSWSGTWGHNQVDATAGDPGNKCFDGNVDSKWGSADVANGDQWVLVRFPEAVTVDGFKLWQDSGPWTNITGYKIQVQKGSDTWDDVYESPEFTEKWREHEHDFETPITITAFRVYLPAENAGGKSAVELTEVQVYKYHRFTYGNGNGNTQLKYDGETKTELSLDGAATDASSTNNPSSNAIDGSNNTKWSSVGNSVPQWIQVILPEVKNLSGFRLVADFNWTDIRAYHVEVATKDGWVKVYEHSGESIEHFQEIDFDTLWNIDSIRFTITEVGPDALQGHGTTSIDILEIKLFTADAIEQETEPETNPQTSDMSIIFILGMTAVLGLSLFKRRMTVNA
jgi:hypothetical protein